MLLLSFFIVIYLVSGEIDSQNQVKISELAFSIISHMGTMTV